MMNPRVEPEGWGLLNEQKTESLGRTLEGFSGDSLGPQLRAVLCGALKARPKHLEFMVNMNFMPIIPEECAGD